jgi:hypothetical protein
VFERRQLLDLLTLDGTPSQEEVPRSGATFGPIRLENASLALISGMEGVVAAAGTLASAIMLGAVSSEEAARG